MKNEIIPTTVNALGTREDVNELADRVKIMTPGGKRLSDNEALALAQISHVTGMNPFIGEIWYIPGKGPMVGIRGARRVADNRILEEGGEGAYYFLEFVIISPEEAGALETEDVLHAYKAILRDIVSTKSYLKVLHDTIDMLKEAGVEDPFGEAKAMIGPKPEWIGYGYSTQNDPTKMNKMRVAQKRAEAMALQQRFSVPFGAQMAAADNYDDTNQGHAPLQPNRSSDEMTQDFDNEVEDAFPQGVVEGEVETDTSQTKRPYDAETLRQALVNSADKIGEVMASKGQRGLMVGMYNEILGGDTERYETCAYLFGRRKSAALSQKQIIVALNHLNGDEKMAALELHAAYKQSQLDKGQKELA